MKFKEELSTVGFFYLASAFFWIAMGIMAGYWVLYYASLGLSFTIIGLIFIANSSAMFIFEIPTGAIADIFGRKVSVGISYLTIGIAYLLVFFSGTNIFLLILFNFIAGIGWTMESGAFEAWFIDTVKHKKKSKHLHKMLGRWGSMGNVGFIVGPFLGAILVGFGYDKALLATSILMLFMGLFIFIFGTESYFKKTKIHISKDIKKTIKNTKFALKFTKDHPTTYLLTIIVFLFTLGSTLVYDAYQPHVIAMGIPAPFIGYALSIGGLLIVLQLNWSHKITKFLGGNKKSLIIYAIAFSLVITSIGFIKYLPLLFITMIGYTTLYDMSGSMAPAFKEISNKVIPSKVRASVLSTIAWFGALAMIIANLIFGFLSDLTSPKIVVILGGITLLISAPKAATSWSM